MNRTKRLLTVLLMLFFVLSLSAFPAAAETAEAATEAELIAQVETGGTVILTDSIALTAPLVIAGDVVLDLNGHTLSPASGFTGDDSLIIVGYGADLTVRDAAGTGVIDASGTGMYAAVKMTRAGDDASKGAAVLKVTGGTLKGKVAGITGNGLRDNTQITVSGGTVSGGEAGIFHPQQGKLSVTGGTVTGDTGIYFCSGELSVTGGTVRGTGPAAAYSFSANGFNSTGDGVVVEDRSGADSNYAPVTVSVFKGATVTSANAAAVSSHAAGSGVPAPSGFITGGSFSSDVSALCADGYHAAGNGTGSFVAHSHSLSFMDAQEATCTDDGRVAHYICSGCSTKYTDAEGTQVLTGDTVIPKSGHAFGQQVPAEAPSCTADGVIAHYTCQTCGKHYSDNGQYTTAVLDSVVDTKLGHSMTHTAALSETCTADGHVAYYTCGTCHLHFTDEAGAQQLAAEDLVLAATGHTLTLMERLPAGCTEPGSSKYYICNITHTDGTVCGVKFWDEAGEDPFETDESEVIPAIGHTFGDLVPAQPSSCTDNGVVAHYTCETCGGHYADNADFTTNLLETVVDEKDGHTMTKTAAVAATCLTDGNPEYYTCGTCGFHFADEAGTKKLEDADLVIEASGHTLIKVDAKAPTCTVPGNTEYWICQCEGGICCGHLFEDEAGTKEITNADAVVIPATNHAGQLTRMSAKAPTCTEPGNVEYDTCSACKGNFDLSGASLESVEVAPLGHSMTKTEAVAVTCLTDGNPEYYTCGTCHLHFADEAGTQKLENADLVIEAPGHTLIKVSAKAPTCTQEGTKEHWICSVAAKTGVSCGCLFEDAEGTKEITDPESVKIPATNHQGTLSDVAAKAPTCTESGNIAHKHCSACNGNFDASGDPLESVSVAATGHTMTKTQGTPATCTADGTKTHYTCGECEGVFADEEGKKPLDDVVIPKGHTLSKVEAKPATCGSTGIRAHYHCSVCGKNFSDVNGQVEMTSVIEKMKNHRLSRVGGTAATCTADGVRTHYHCSLCNQNFTDIYAETVVEDTVIPKLGHDVVKVPYKKATATSTGNKTYYKCKNCGEWYWDAECTKLIENHKDVIIPRTTGNPDTGDHSNITLYIVLASVSAAAVVGLLILGKKRKK